MLNKRNEIANITFILLIIYLSGNVFFRSYYYSITVGLVFFVSLYIFFITQKIKKINYRSILFLIVFIILSLITLTLNGWNSLSSYIAIFLQMVIAIIATEVIDIEKFKIYYLKIAIFLSVVSLVFHLGGSLFPGLISFLPKVEGISSVDYHNAYIHIYQSFIGYNRFVLNYRNAGIFWEPGAYQAFLNIALLFLLDFVRNSKIDIKKGKFLILILITTIISTQSTTGYGILLILIFTYHSIFLRIMRPKSYQQLLLYLVFGILFAFVIFNQLSSGLELMVKKYIDNYEEIFKRVSFEEIRLVFSNTKTFLFGVSYTNDLNTGKIWNSIIQTAVVSGFPYATLLLFNYLRGSKYFIKKWYILFFVLIIIFSTENFFWRPLFLYIAFAHPHKFQYN